MVESWLGHPLQEGSQTLYLVAQGSKRVKMEPNRLLKAL